MFKVKRGENAPVFAMFIILDKLISVKKMKLATFRCSF